MLTLRNNIDIRMRNYVIQFSSIYHRHVIIPRNSINDGISFYRQLIVKFYFNSFLMILCSFRYLRMKSIDGWTVLTVVSTYFLKLLKTLNGIYTFQLMYPNLSNIFPYVLEINSLCTYTKWYSSRQMDLQPVLYYSSPSWTHHVSNSSYSFALVIKASGVSSPPVPFVISLVCVNYFFRGIGTFVDFGP